MGQRDPLGIPRPPPRPAAIVFTGLLVWAYVDGKSGWLTYVVGPEAFYYWTIAHVTMSFFPR